MNYVLLFLFCLLQTKQFAHAASDPEVYMSVLDLIKRWGYPAEFHDVMTADGYILGLFRIPHGRHSAANSTCQRPAILLVHGLAASTEFVLNPPESAPAFLLADAGFDVFILNHRGSTYSKRHSTLKPWDNKFWQFTMDELAKYDATATVDKVLELSGKSSLYWLGHSQGTSIGFMLLSDFPAYNHKVKALIQLAPAATLGYAKGLINILFFAYRNLKPITDFYRVVLGAHEVSQSIGFIYRPLIQLCIIIPFGPEVCNYAIGLAMGPSAYSYNLTRAPVYLSHIPTGISTWQGLHYAQMATHLKVEHMDHNPLENLQRYGQEKPPPYDFSKIDVPVYLFWGTVDWLTTGEEVQEIILKTLRKEVVKGNFEIPGYNHLDYAIAPDCAEKVYNPIIGIARNRESDMCVD